MTTPTTGRPAKALTMVALAKMDDATFEKWLRKYKITGLLAAFAARKRRALIKKTERTK